MSYVRERVAGLDELAIDEVAAAMQQQMSPSCITNDVLEPQQCWLNRVVIIHAALSLSN